MDAKYEEVAKAQRRLPKIQTELEAAEVSIPWIHVFASNLNRFQTRFKAASDEIERLEREISELGNIDHLNNNSRELQDKIRANKTTLSQFKVNLDPVNCFIESTSVCRMMSER